jgi:ribokinase
MSKDHTPRIAVAGYLSIDRIRGIDGVEREVMGGAALYAALGVVAAGGTPVLFAAAGADLPLDVLFRLERLGVDLSALERRDHPTRRVRLDYDTADERRSPHWQDQAWWQATEALAPPQVFGTFDATLLCPMPAAAAARILDAGSALGPVVADTSGAFARRERDALLALLSRIAMFAPSIAESRLLYPDLSDDAALAAMACILPLAVQKRGAAGLAVKRAGAAPLALAPATGAVIETTGAGDATAGALALGAALRLPDRTLLVRATRIAALAVSAPGPSGLGFDGVVHA